MIPEQLYPFIRYALIFLVAAAVSFGWFGMTSLSPVSPFDRVPVWVWGGL
jgi:hypothetical protein